MKSLLHKIIKEPSGMTMVIVLTVIFVVLMTIGTGAAIIANNLNKAGGQSAKGKAEVSATVALEKLRGMYKIDKRLFDGCAVGDCIDPISSGCVACIDNKATYNEGDVKYKIEILKLTPAYMDRGKPMPGSTTLLTTGYYKNVIKQSSNDLCLNYCSVANYNCTEKGGDNGCGGSCGTCTEPETCGGGGKTNVCGSQVLGNCSDVTKECDINCPVGSTCGGGTIVDAENHIIVTPPGCNPNSVIPCTDPNSGTDSFSARWDSTKPPGNTGANDQTDGRNNSVLLNDARYEAAKSCIDGNYNNFSWYLPSTAELAMLYSAYQSGYGIGYDTNGCYWTSSQYESDMKGSAHINGFNPMSLSCNQLYAAKNAINYIRCIRRYSGPALNTCNDPNTECTPDCVNGDLCGGGTLIDSANHLVASLAGCDGANTCCYSTSINDCNGVTDSLTGAWDNAGTPNFTGAQDEYDGAKNMINTPADPQYEAANYCRNASYYSFSGWFLPATTQLASANYAFSQSWTSGWNDACYWSSTETNFEQGSAYSVGLGSANGNCNEGSGDHKQRPFYVRCLRTY